MKYLLSAGILLLSFYSISCNDAVTEPVNTAPPPTPVVSLIAPDQNAFVLDTAVIEVNATDDKGIIKVEIYIDNVTNNARTLLLKPYKYIWITPQTEDSGRHLVYAKAYDADDNATSTDVRTITVLRFQAPSDLQIVSMSTTQTQLQWKDNASTETGFEIEQSTNNGAFSLIKSVAANTISTVINGVFDSSSTYAFRVRAITSTKQSKYSNVEYRSLSLGALVRISGGTFEMGNTVTWINGATPPHNVTLSEFYISPTEITWQLWNTVTLWGKNNGFSDLPAGAKGYSGGTSQHPVTLVNWYDAVKWCNARSQMEGLVPVYYTGTTFSTENVYKTGEVTLAVSNINTSANGYRLPTEAEWEYAAQGGSSRHNPSFMYSGSNVIDSVAWYSANAGGNTHPVGLKGSNEAGLYDMSGNVLEWCWDWNGIYSNTAQTNPTGPSTGTVRIIRSGATHHDNAHCHIANRNTAGPSVRDGDLGFRVCRSK